MAVVRRLPALIALLLLAGCTASSGGTTADAPSSSSPGSPSASAVSATATLRCGDSIDGSAPPDGFQVVLGAVALPTSSAGPALQASDSGEPDVPLLFAKTGLLVRAGVAAELTVADPPGNRVGISWGNPGPGPSRRFVVPACADAYGSGWLAYPGGYWADEPLCLPLTVRAGGREQQVRIGVGTACPGQQPPVGNG